MEVLEKIKAEPLSPETDYGQQVSETPATATSEHPWIPPDRGSAVRDAAGNYVCRYCTKSWKTVFALNAHMRKHTTTADKPHKCSTCGAQFVQKRSLTKHLAIVHLQFSDGRNLHGQSTNEQSLLGQVSEVKSEISIVKQVNVKQVSNELMYKCTVCGQAYSDATTLTLHEQQRHSNGRPSYACQHCDKRFSRKSDVTRHEQRHTSERRFRCDFCPKRFTDAIAQRRHELGLHAGDAAFACRHCPQTFTAMQAAKEHIQEAHSGEAVEESDTPDDVGSAREKGLQCKVCDKYYANTSSLTIHMQRHSRPYPCRYCPKSYETRYKLRRHVLIHAGIKRYPCFYCAQSFHYTRARMAHVVNCHDNQGTLTCRLCGGHFESLDVAKQHELKTHNTDKPTILTQCADCHKSFKYGKHYQEHLAMHAYAQLDTTTDPSAQKHEPISDVTPVTSGSTENSMGTVMPRKKRKYDEDDSMNHLKRSVESSTDLMDTHYNSDTEDFSDSFGYKADFTVSRSELSRRRVVLSSKVVLNYRSKKAQPKNYSYFTYSRHTARQEKAYSTSRVVQRDQGLIECRFCFASFNSRLSLRLHEQRFHKHIKRVSCSGCAKTLIQGPRPGTQPVRKSRDRSRAMQERGVSWRLKAPASDVVDTGDSNTRMTFSDAEAGDTNCASDDQTKDMGDQTRDSSSQTKPNFSSDSLTLDTVASIGTDSYSLEITDFKACEFTSTAESNEPFLIEDSSSEVPGERQLPESQPSRSAVGTASTSVEPEAGRSTLLACVHCHFTFPSAENLAKHERLHRKKPAQVCPACGERFRTERALELHSRKVHRGQKIFKCSLCDAGYSRLRKMRAHEREHINPPQHPCLVCDETFHSANVLQTHMFNVHLGGRPRPHVCDQCGKTFTCSTQLGYHMKTHEGRRDVECEICHKRFLREIDMRRHAKSMHPSVNTTVQCDQCGGTFKSRQSLYVHMKSHTKPYKCRYCDKTFARSKLQKDHETLHTGEKPFKCQFCSKSFRHLRVCTIHERSHTGERPHPCNYCEKRFYTKTDLGRHERLHTGEKPYECDECGQRFTLRATVKSHKKNVHGVTLS